MLKAGDRVEVLPGQDNGVLLQCGRVYTVSKLEYIATTIGPLVYLHETEGGYFTKRFRLVADWVGPKRDTAPPLEVNFTESGKCKFLVYSDRMEIVLGDNHRISLDHKSTGGLKGALMKRFLK